MAKKRAQRKPGTVYENVVAPKQQSQPGSINVDEILQSAWKLQLGVWGMRVVVQLCTQACDKTVSSSMISKTLSTAMLECKCVTIAMNDIAVISRI